MEDVLGKGVPPKDAARVPKFSDAAAKLRASSAAMLRVLILAGVIAFIPFLVYSNAIPKRFSGDVIAAPEGDLLILRVAGQHLNVRLAGIDAPNPGQPFSNQSRESLSALALGKHVQCVEQTRYRTNGVIAFCTAEGADLSVEQVSRGAAWAYEAYDQLVGIQQEVRAGKLGLWKDPSPVPPWRW